MDHYLKTDLGIQTLKQRTLQLNARQRQLLLLIGTDDFRILHHSQKQRIAPPELIQQLKELGLIFDKIADPMLSSAPQASEIITDPLTEKSKQNNINNHVNFTSESTIKIVDSTSQSLNNLINDKKNESIISLQLNDALVKTQFHKQQNNETILPETCNLNFNEVKQSMAKLLQIYCGLMTKQLIIQIQNANSVREIKLCQMQWITALQESRISPIELNKLMHQINHSLQHL